MSRNFALTSSSGAGYDKSKARDMLGMFAFLANVYGIVHIGMLTASWPLSHRLYLMTIPVQRITTAE